MVNATGDPGAWSGVREVNDADLPSTSWVNTTLQYTHGYGMIVVAGQHRRLRTGDPAFAVGGRPADVDQRTTRRSPSRRSTSGSTTPGYVVANTKQPEIDYQLTNGTNVETHYTGERRCAVVVVLQAADVRGAVQRLNLLISNQITDQSGIMFDRGVQARVSKAAPFLSLDADPYPVLSAGTSTGSRTPTPRPTTTPTPRTPTPVPCRAASGSQQKPSTTSATR